MCSWLGEPGSSPCQPQGTSAHLHGGAVLGLLLLRGTSMATPGHQQSQFAVAVVHQVQDCVLCRLTHLLGVSRGETFCL